jgi:hypothetical protein
MAVVMAEELLFEWVNDKIKVYRENISAHYTLLGQQINICYFSSG